MSFLPALASSVTYEDGIYKITSGEDFKKITDMNGKEYKGLGFFDFVTLESDKRIVTDSLCEFESKEIIGFVNKCSQIFGIDKPFFTVKRGAGDGDDIALSSKGDNRTEGIKTDGFYGTHIIGPLLVRNPEMADYFAQQVINNA